MATIILILFTLPTIALIVSIIMGFIDFVHYGLLFYPVSIMLCMIILLLGDLNKKIEDVLDKIDDFVF